MTESGRFPRTSASAPGKLILAGEYAVLDGAPAICMAVNRRARVTIERGTDDYHTVDAPGFIAVTGRFRAANGECQWLSGKEEFRLFDDVWRTAHATSAEPLRIVLDTSEYLDTETGAKIGLGSSAALTVALSAALCLVAEVSADATRIAYAAHRQFQAGLGSGADIACCSAGGLIEYSMAGSTVRKLEWPAGLHYALLWSGVPVSTTAKLDHLEKRAPGSTREALVSAAERTGAAWQSGNAGRILDASRNYTQVLRDYSIDHDLGIFDAGHAALTDAADRAGLAYKPCGAGGGDMGVAFADEPATIDEFVRIAAEHDFRALDLTLDPQGVRLAQEQN